MTENVTENESKENHVNIKPQKKENILMKWLWFIILIAVIGFIILFISCYIFSYIIGNYYISILLLPIIYFISAIVLKAGFGIVFFWSAIMPIFIIFIVWLIVFIFSEHKGDKYYKSKIEELSKRLLNANLAKIRYKNELHKFIDDDDDIEFCQENSEEIRDRIIKIRRQEAEIRKQKAEEEKQKALEQIQNEAAEQIRANEDAMKKNEVERNMDELGDYINMLGESIQEKELPKAKIVSELSKILDLIFNNKSYIAKEDFNKIRNDNKVFIKHVFEKCYELENFSGSLLETRMKQVKEKFTKILK